MTSILRKALPTALKELRLHGCQTSPASAGVRAFIQSSYLPIKTANPDLKILIREAHGTPPRVWARFGLSSLWCMGQGGNHLNAVLENGVEKQASLDGAMDASAVESKIVALLK
ncbi:hypothetical protein BT69DRAFT_1303756 [Atractiella rhizophila]|nr:hypothetical protein BT69DRAFT_1303756 [Atractiella rhizophila]